jgi:hypothetical protein
MNEGEVMDRSQALGYIAEKELELEQERLGTLELRYRIEWAEHCARNGPPRRRLALHAGTLLVRLGERLQSWAATGRPEWQGP